MLPEMKITKPSIYLCAFFIVTQFINGFNDAGGKYSDVSTFWYIAALYWALNWWVIVDLRNHGTNWKYGYLDMGMFLYVAGFFIIPYYLFKTRGWKVLYKIVLFLGVIIGAYISGAILSFLISIF